MLNPRSDPRLQRLQLHDHLLELGVLDRLDCAALGRDVLLALVGLRLLLCTDVAGVGVNDLFLAMQQRVDLAHVRRIGGRRRHRVRQPRVDVHADMGHHPEMPLIALLGLVQLGIALAVGILGRAPRRDDCRVHDRSLLEHQALAVQVRFYRLLDPSCDVLSTPATPTAPPVVTQAVPETTPSKHSLDATDGGAKPPAAVADTRNVLSQ